MSENSKIHQSKIGFPKVNALHSVPSPLLISETISSFSREEKAAPSILDSCSQKWPYPKADDMASSKIKCNVCSFYNKVDRLSCHERCDIVHNV